MLNKKLISLLDRHKSSDVNIRYKQQLYPANSLFMENGVLYLRSLMLLTDAEKAECDVAYGEESEKATGEDLIDKLKKYEDDVLVRLNLPDGNFDCYFHYDVKENDTVELQSMQEKRR